MGRQTEGHKEVEGNSEEGGGGGFGEGKMNIIWKG